MQITFAIALLASMPATPPTNATECEKVEPQAMTLPGTTAYIYRETGKAPLRIWVLDRDRHSTRRPAPGILFFYGGGWVGGDARQFLSQARHFAAEGYVAAVADYRVKCRYGNGPAKAVDDARAAIRWFRAHSAKLAMRADRVVVAGGSAGGQLALSASALPGRKMVSRPDALLLFNPVVDLTLVGVRKYTAGRTEKYVRSLSPSNFPTSGLPPMIIFHGDDDKTVPVESTRSYCARVVASRGTCVFYTFKNADHGFFNPGRAKDDQGRSLYDVTLERADAFLSELGFAPPRSSP